MPHMFAHAQNFEHQIVDVHVLAQVGKLLSSLNIDPAALPANWEDIYRCGLP